MEMLEVLMRMMDMEVDKVADMVVDKDMVAYNQYSFWSFQIFH